MIHQDPQTRLAEGLTLTFATLTLADCQAYVAIAVGLLGAAVYVTKLLEMWGIKKTKPKVEK